MSIGYRRRRSFPRSNARWWLNLAVSIFVFLQVGSALGQARDDRVFERIDSLSRVAPGEAYAMASAVFSDVEDDPASVTYGRACIRLAGILMIRGEVERADSFLQLMTLSMDSLCTDERFADWNHYSGNLQLMRGNHELGLRYFVESYECNKELERIAPLIKVTSNIGAIFLSRGMYEKSLEYFEEGASLAYDREQFETYAAILINSSIAKKHLKDTSGSFALISKAEPYVLKCNTHIQYAFHANMTDMLLHYGQLEKVPYHTERMLELARKIKSLEKEAIAYSGFGQYDMRKGRWSQALRNFEKALALYPPDADRKNLGNLYQGMYEVLKARGDFSSALEYLEKYEKVHSELREEESQKTILALERNFSIEKERAKTLEREVELYTVQAKLTKRTMMWYGTIGGLLLALVLALLFWRNMQRNREVFKAKMERQEIQHQYDMLSQFQEGEREERKRMSRDLHDGIGGMLVAAKMTLTPLARDETGSKVVKIIDQTYKELRALSHQLAPIKLEEKGLLGACDYFAQLLRDSKKVELVLDLEDSLEKLDIHYQVFLYRAFQELVTNAIKHGQATKILVRIGMSDDRVDMVVEDDGIGMPEHLRNKDNSGMGLRSILAQLKIQDGDLSSHHSERLGGAKVLLYFFLKPRVKAEL